MLQHISWGQFIGFVSIALLLYFVGVIIYAKAILKTGPGKKTVWHPVSPDSVEGPETPGDQLLTSGSRASHGNRQPASGASLTIQTTDDSLPAGTYPEADESLSPALEEIDNLSENITKILLNAGPQTDKTSLLEQLRQQISDLDIELHPAMRHAINSLIIEQAQTLCQVDVSHEEAIALWL